MVLIHSSGARIAYESCQLLAALSTSSNDWATAITTLDFNKNTSDGNGTSTGATTDWLLCLARIFITRHRLATVLGTSEPKTSGREGDGEGEGVEENPFTSQIPTPIESPSKSFSLENQSQSSNTTRSTEQYEEDLLCFVLAVLTTGVLAGDDVVKGIANLSELILYLSEIRIP